MKTKNKIFKAPLVVFSLFFVFLCILFVQYLYLALSNKVYGIDMGEFASNRNTYSTITYAKRGSIYDSNGDILAMDVSSYTIVAYLSETRTGNSTTLYHVKDKEKTAEALSTVLDMTKEEILTYLNKEKLYQTYLGIKGKNISEVTKKKIEELNLPGIEFEENYKRYYPNGDFSSYMIGYAKNKNYIKVTKDKEYDLNVVLKTLIGSYEKITFKIYSNDVITITSDGIMTALDKGTTTIEIFSNGRLLNDCVVEVFEEETKTKLETKIIGELGIESKFEETLKGINGYLEYQADRYGYKIPDTKEEKVDAVNGSDIYLTLDANIQRILESSVEFAEENYEPEWFTINVMDAKTGDILGSASSPSYNPNDLNTLVNYENPLTSFVYEPGSVMKIYTYMCAIEKGTYKGSETYPSGSITFDENVIYDWNKKGWGEITYDYGFELSSNVAVSYMTQKFIDKNDLKSCLTSYGFGSKTNIELSREMTGSLVFNYPVEVAAASYGQGISTTPIQQLQALSIIANDGYMLKPHIVSKIVDNGNVTYEKKVEKSEKIVSEETVDYIKKLMYNTVNNVEGNATGIGYRIEGLDVIGKTGTAEVYDSSTDSYSTVWNNKIYSFAGMFPYDDPEIIIFVSLKKPNNGSTSALINTTKQAIESIAKYKGLIKSNTTIQNNKFNLDYYVNQDINLVRKDLEEKGLDVIVLGDGDRIIKQYPSKDSSVITNDKIFLVTNGSITMPNISGYSRIEAISLFNLLDIDYEIEGYGNVISQSILPGEIIGNNIKIVLKQEHEL